jgi:cullin 1
LHPLKDVGLLAFRDAVYGESRRRARDALLKLVEREREGELVDKALAKNVLDIFIEVGMGSLDAYERDFEEDLVRETSAYYRRKAADWVSADSCPEYMLKAEECLRQEEERVEAYLHPSTRGKLLREAEQELLARHQQALLSKEGSGAAALLRDDREADLSRMYRLFWRVPRGLEPVAEAFKEHVEAEGMRLVREVAEAAEARRDRQQQQQQQQQEGEGAAGAATADRPDKAAPAPPAPDAAYVRRVVDLHDKYTRYVQHCFGGASLFHKALKEAFEAFVNKPVAGATSAELMAGFCDTLLRKGGGGAAVAGGGGAAGGAGGGGAGAAATGGLGGGPSDGGGVGGAGAGASAGGAAAAAAAGGDKLGDEAMEETLDKVVKLLAYVSDKDLFSEFYRKRLARRLLQDRSASDEHERAVLARLKQQCGAQFTSKMEGMVNDLHMAREKQRQFDAWRQRQAERVAATATAAGAASSSNNLDLGVTVLTTGFWPTYKAVDLRLPREMAEGVESFRTYYDAENKHRRLTWVHAQGTAVVRGNFDARPVEMVVSTMQAAVLLLFNDGGGGGEGGGGGGSSAAAAAAGGSGGDGWLGFQEVCERANLPEEDASRLLHSLSCARYKARSERWGYWGGGRRAPRGRGGGGGATARGDPRPPTQKTRKLTTKPPNPTPPTTTPSTNRSCSSSPRARPSAAATSSAPTPASPTASSASASLSPR